MYSPAVSAEGPGEGFTHTHPSSRLEMRLGGLKVRSSRHISGLYLPSSLNSQMYEEPHQSP